MRTIKVVGLTHSEWQSFWRASLEAIKEGASKDCLYFSTHGLVRVVHDGLGLQIIRQDWRAERVVYLNAANHYVWYSGLVDLPWMDGERDPNYVFGVFNGMEPRDTTRNLFWMKKSMSVDDHLIFPDADEHYVCAETGWTRLL